MSSTHKVGDIVKVHDYLIPINFQYDNYFFIEDNLYKESFDIYMCKDKKLNIIVITDIFEGIKDESKHAGLRKKSFRLL